MEIRNLYPEFFDEGKKGIPYEIEQEYWQDLFCYLDLTLSIGILLRIHMQKGEAELNLRQIHLRGIPLHAEELLREITRSKT